MYRGELSFPESVLMEKEGKIKQLEERVAFLEGRRKELNERCSSLLDERNRARSDVLVMKRHFGI